MARRKTSLIALKEISEINMTPLMDLTFILLITFIITFPLIEQGVPVNLPSGKAAELESANARSITIDAKGNLFLDELPITKEELAREMEIISGIGSETPVYVRADKNIKYEAVADVMVILHNAKITRMALVTEE
ncbi:MAG: biopolymer transport protein TolR [Verrucomicrobiota bacterium]|jgi:biopolymer transport protein TolR|nr:biopolymer transport protein TolR [Verrucomicrobiota bacterium]MDK2963457.1 biopolymer transport protein TolR [Verrucomicrobiota bacterium]